MIIRSIDGKIIGDLENGVFTKSVAGSKHQLRTPPAWAVDKSAYERYLRGACQTMIVNDTETGLRYEVSFAMFEARKGLLNRGFGQQYFLPLHYWHIITKEQPKLFK